MCRGFPCPPVIDSLPNSAQYAFNAFNLNPFSLLARDKQRATYAVLPLFWPMFTKAVNDQFLYRLVTLADAIENLLHDASNLSFTVSYHTPM